MLVLSRKKDESIYLYVEGLPDPITITICALDKNKTRVGIEADDRVLVVRAELGKKTDCVVAKVAS